MNRVEGKELVSFTIKSLLTFKTSCSEYCVLSWYKCKYSVVYLRTVSSKVHGIEQT